ncbi:MAG: hypothetical protein H0U98_16400 [Alphaproteobacteria bacterium]|nr:hypothetical protein [Alphaproteobacteria bacterium]
MKARITVGIAVAVLSLSPAASAQTRTMAEHAQTASALQCLLDHVRNACSLAFVGSASGPATQWLWWNANKDVEVGALRSSDYAGTEAVNAYLTKFLNGRVADVYHVKFGHQEKTFYIVPPGPDGKVHYMRIRQGGPDDERTDLFTYGPG